MSLSRTSSIVEFLRRPRLFWAIPAVTIILGAGLAARSRVQAPPPAAATYVITHSIRVIEADTLEVTIDGKRVGVGLVGVKAPAGNTACGRQAISALYGLMAHGIELRDDARASTFDKRHRRMFRVALLPNHTSLAVSLANAGLVVPDPNDSSGEEYPDVVAAIAGARQLRRGCAS